jgi:hypothetical protein
MVTSDEPMNEFTEALAELDEALGDARDGVAGVDWTKQRNADIRLMAVLKNLNERLSKLERFQEGH